MKNEEYTESTTLSVIGFVLMIFAIAPYGAHIMQTGWNWFVAPLGIAPALTFWQALGLMSFIGFLRTRINKDEAHKPFAAFIVCLIAFSLSYLTMYVVHLLQGWLQ